MFAEKSVREDRDKGVLGEVEVRLLVSRSQSRCLLTKGVERPLLLLLLRSFSAEYSGLLSFLVWDFFREHGLLFPLFYLRVSFNAPSLHTSPALETPLDAVYIP